MHRHLESTLRIVTRRQGHRYVGGGKSGSGAPLASSPRDNKMNIFCEKKCDFFLNIFELLSQIKGNSIM